ncbi:transglycosylase SLT domain-containing protein [Novosphingobium aquimarinum]|uniref:transglycosylase SLT domain-containing protein n=1 Tax=Novosphingobium aquimarinum TaxID=2682494 RepID=UPI001E5FFFFF|nr:transglycosylase SLT domain-containing protein [Novosphingobium aquimarinum]
MSEAQATGTIPSGAVNGGGSPVRAAIAHASRKTGVDFNYLLAQAKIESSLNPSANAPTSSAAGLYQFTRGTWLETLERHGADHGLGWAGNAIQGGRITNPALASQIMALRYDPNASSLMAAELAGDNRSALQMVLGREPDSAELYLGHFLGAQGATSFLTALAANPDQSAAGLMPAAARANRSIFYAGNTPRSLAGVMSVIRGKVDGAMEGGDAAQWASIGGDYNMPNFAAMQARAQTQQAPEWGGEIAREYHASLPATPQVRTASMADTLASSFGGAASEGTPANVRNAYSKLARFGL